MELPTHILLAYGYFLLFAWILVEQMGVPLPATPVLLAAGALTAEHELSFPFALLVSVYACMIADSSWYFIGKYYGHHVLRVLCRMTLEPTSCVSKTQTSVGHRRQVTLLLAKFVPGLAALASPVAGQRGMPYREFLLFDTLGSTLWVTTLLTAGRVFGDALKRDPNVLDWVGRFSGVLLVLGVAGFFTARVYRRRLILKKLIASRLEPEELKRQLDAGEPVYIVDLRHPLELVPDPYTLPGAHHVSPETLALHAMEIPRDRDVVLYCTCPSEATAAKTAMALQKLGIERVRPLRGGYDEWKRLGYPMDAVPPVIPDSTLVQLEG